MTVVDLYTIQIIHDGGIPVVVKDDYISEAEENLTDLLPAGYRARIRRWDQPTQEEDDE